MKSPPRNRHDRQALECEIDEELRFHIETQARAYEMDGFEPEEAFAKAAVRFGDVTDIKRQCVRIRQRHSVTAWVMKALFAISFLLGVVVRTLSIEANVTQVGNLLLMIGVLGLLLIFGKRVGSTIFPRDRESIELGLRDGVLPVSFDEQGRTPFDRVRDPATDYTDFAD